MIDSWHGNPGTLNVSQTLTHPFSVAFLLRHTFAYPLRRRLKHLASIPLGELVSAGEFPATIQKEF
jgi:hypothetical protein